MSKTDKRTLVHKLDVSGLNIDEIMAAMQKSIHGFREDGWHFASHMLVPYTTRLDRKAYVLCTFCR